MADAATPETRNQESMRGRLGETIDGDGETGSRGNLKHHTSRSDQILGEQINQPRREGHRSSYRRYSNGRFCFQYVGVDTMNVQTFKFKLEGEEVVEWST